MNVNVADAAYLPDIACVGRKSVYIWTFPMVILDGDLSHLYHEYSDSFVEVPEPMDDS